MGPPRVPRPASARLGPTQQTGGRLGGYSRRAIDPETWAMPAFAALVVCAVRESQRLRDLGDEAENL
ncbi:MULTISPECIES: hypothetical protein [Streptomyces]|uniref:hypothetical protein n=1 Tax=Streptomyces TaxID=1883 RepID=UPI001319BD6B|nr:MULTISPECIES: hypothetical protein [Streptomyces]MYS91930.1 hypothetical protein [Streptomyces sp. SID5464]